LLYDLYEATIPGEVTTTGLTIVQSGESMEHQVERAIEKLSVTEPAFANLVRKAYIAARSIVQDVPKETFFSPNRRKS